MAVLRGMRERFRALFHRKTVEHEMEEEFHFHLEQAVERNIERGMSSEEARRIALMEFGGVERVKEETRQERGAGFFFDLGKDIRHAARDLRRKPGFAAVTIITLALCIGVNAVIFSLVNTIILQPLPYPESDRLVYMFMSYPGAEVLRAVNSISGYFDRRKQVDVFSDVAMFNIGGGIVGEGESSHHVFTTHVTFSYFDVLQTEPHLGRLFTAEDDLREGALTVVLSHTFWLSEFGGDGSAIGRDLIVGESPHRIIGVLPEHFIVPGWDTDIWMVNRLPEDLHTDDNRFNESSGWEMIGRL